MWLNIKDKLVAQMIDIKEMRLLAERRAIVLGRLEKLKAVVTAARSAQPKRTAADEDKPRCRDLAMMPELREMIEAPNDVAVTEETMPAVPLVLPFLEKRWLRERKAELVAMLRETGVDREARKGVDLLGLAAVVFKCKNCNRFMHHPQVLMHECKSGARPGNEPGALYSGCVFDAFGRTHPWARSTFCVAPQVESVRALIKLCGKDPKMVTHNDMDAAGLKVVFNEWFVMSWRRAVSLTSVARSVHDLVR